MLRKTNGGGINFIFDLEYVNSIPPFADNVIINHTGNIIMKEGEEGVWGTVFGSIVLLENANGGANDVHVSSSGNIMCLNFFVFFFEFF